ncbi:MAG TPA: cyanophycinase [Thermoanaerobaculia bacterium]|nr:cyanophycinase [Thermoanaerobaculia bacterium]
MTIEELIGNGCVMAIGGNEDKRAASESILAAFVRRAGGKQARIVIIPSASVAPKERGERYTRIFNRFRAGVVQVVRAELGVTVEQREAIRTATGIFVTGGDQLRLMRFLRSADCIDEILEAVREGAVYAGTSAGASALSRRMIARSRRKRGAELVEFDEGLGLIPHAIIDQHFGERRRLSRLIAASHEHRLTGIGIDENTAVVWSHDGVITVEGAGEVTIVNPDHGRMEPHAQTYRLQILRRGAKFVAD